MMIEWMRMEFGGSEWQDSRFSGVISEGLYE